MKHYDITIIGAGPAGSTLARKLQDKYSVLLVDKRPLDTEPTKLIKNCGGLIAPDAQKALASFGLSIPKEVLVSPQMFSVETLDFDNSMTQTYQRNYINVDRERYDRWLISLCNKNIDKAFSSRFRGAVKKEDYYEINLLTKLGKKVVTSDIIIGADGANSKVKKELLGLQKHESKRYISIQEWFPNTTGLNQFVAIFDEEISDFYSWIIPKDNGIIFGSAIEEEKDTGYFHNLQKEKLKKLGYNLSNSIKKEGCYILRPKSSKDICLGKENVALIGEAAGLISPTSAEGISYAMLSGDILGEAIIENKKNFLTIYEQKVNFLKKNITKKMLKYPAMYNKKLRKIIFKLGIGSMNTKLNMNPQTTIQNKITPIMVK